MGNGMKCLATVVHLTGLVNSATALLIYGKPKTNYAALGFHYNLCHVAFGGNSIGTL